MKLKDYTQAEITAMSYDDIAFMILTEENQKMKINELFRKVANLYRLSDDAYISQIGDFFELLSTDQRFVMLEDGYWDLKSKHTSKVIIDDEEDEDELLNEALEEDEEEYSQENNEDEEIFYDNDETDDPTDDELQDFVVVDEEDEDQPNIN